MGISKKKRQYIKKNYPKLSLEIISADTGASVKEVEKVLGIKVPDQKTNYIKLFDLVLEWGVLIAVFIAPFILMPDLRDAANIPQNAFVQSASLFLALVWGLKCIADKKLCFVHSPLIFPLSAFVIWCLVSLIVAVNLFEGFHVFFQVLSMFVFFLVVLNVYYKKKDFNRLIMALVLSGGIIALIGCCQYLFEFSWIPQARPPAATFTNRNMASQFIVLVIPFGFYLFLKTENYIVGWIATLLTGLMVLYAVYTKSLAAWVSISVEAIVFISILIYLVKTGKYQFKIKSRLYALVLTFTGFLLLINIDSGGFNLKFGGLSDQVTSVQEFVESKSSSGVDVVRSDAAVKGQSSIEWRWSVWLNSMAMIKDNPLIGVGAGNYKIEYPLYNHKVLKDTKFNLENQLDRAHNDYIQAAAEFGITGFVIALWAVVCFYYILFCLFKGDLSDLSGKKLLLAAALMSAGTGMLFNAGFSFPFQRAIPPFIVMLIFAIACVMHAQKIKTSHTSIIDTRLLYAVTFVFTLLFFYIGHYHYTMIKADKYFGRTIRCYNNGNWKQLLHEADKALSYNAGRKRVLFYKGFASNELGQIKKSIQYYEELIQYFPNYINGLLNLGIVYGKVGENAKAVEIFKKIIVLTPDKGGYYSDTGYYLTKLGKLDQAYTYLKKGAELEKENAIILLNFAATCIQMKKYSEARKVLEKVAELEPDWDQPGQYLKYINEQT